MGQDPRSAWMHVCLHAKDKTCMPWMTPLPPPKQQQLCWTQGMRWYHICSSGTGGSDCHCATRVHCSHRPFLSRLRSWLAVLDACGVARFLAVVWGRVCTSLVSKVEGLPVGQVPPSPQGQGQGQGWSNGRATGDLPLRFADMKTPRQWLAQGR